MNKSFAFILFCVLLFATVSGANLRKANSEWRGGRGLGRGFGRGLRGWGGLGWGWPGVGLGWGCPGVGLGWGWPGVGLGWGAPFLGWGLGYPVFADGCGPVVSGGVVASTGLSVATTSIVGGGVAIL